MLEAADEFVGVDCRGYCSKNSLMTVMLCLIAFHFSQRQVLIPVSFTQHKDIDSNLFAKSHLQKVLFRFVANTLNVADQG